ncbi:DUF148 domain-containing protein [Trichostrongylus colubriformis]|uniref:DUF148 domain-containing protein n=1 Tax=Trichostrongylus colubriformis TaxID=6319 RepID=A0AAN8EQR3_TRICO
MNTIICIVVLAGVVLSAPGGMSGIGRGNHKNPLLPPFLQNVSREARREYFKIILSKNETIAQQKEEALEWAKKYDVEDEMKEYNQNVTNIKKELKKNVTELIEALPSALEDFSKVLENDDQTHSEMKQALKKLISEKPKEYSVLFYALGKEIFSGHPREIRNLIGGQGRNETSDESQGSTKEDSEEMN